MTTHKFICPGGVLYARITDVHQPLTVEMLRLLFRQSGDGDLICAFERVVDGMYGVEAYVQFGSRWKAARARAAMDGQTIYDGSCVLAVDLVPSAYTTITMPDGDVWTPAHFFDDTPYAEWDEALVVAEHHNEASASTSSPVSASAVSNIPTNPVPVAAATGIPMSSESSAAPASCGITSLVASATNHSTSPGGDTGAEPYTTPLVSTGPIGVPASTMCSTECPREGNNATRATPTPIAASLASSDSAVPATCEVSTEVSTMALMDVSISAPTPTEVTTTEMLLDVTLGKLAPAKCLTECPEVSDAQSSALSLAFSVSNAQVVSADKLFNERPWHVDIDNDSKLDKVVSRGNVPVAALTTLNTNSSDLGQELRPLPWPSFAHSQKGGQLNDNSSLEVCWGCCITETLQGKTRGFYSCAWMDFVQNKVIIGVHSEKPWLPLQGMYRLHYFGKPHEGICFYHISLHSHATSPGYPCINLVGLRSLFTCSGAEVYSLVPAQMGSLCCELFAFGVYQPFVQIFGETFHHLLLLSCTSIRTPISQNGEVPCFFRATDREDRSPYTGPSIDQAMRLCLLTDLEMISSYNFLSDHEQIQWKIAWLFSLACSAADNKSNGFASTEARKLNSVPYGSKHLQWEIVAVFNRKTSVLLCENCSAVYASAGDLHVIMLDATVPLQLVAPWSQKGFGSDAHVWFLGSSFSDLILLIFAKIDWHGPIWSLNWHGEKTSCYFWESDSEQSSYPGVVTDGTKRWYRVKLKAWINQFGLTVLIVWPHFTMIQIADLCSAGMNSWDYSMPHVSPMVLTIGQIQQYWLAPIQLKIAWSLHLDYPSGDNPFVQPLLTNSVLLFLLVVPCRYLGQEQVQWKFAGEAYIVEHYKTQCKDVGFSPSATTTHLQIWQADFVALFSSKEAMNQSWVFHCQRVCSVSAWWRDNLDNVNDAYWKGGFDTLQVTWDPGGSTQYRLEDETAEWVRCALQTPWDPGGSTEWDNWVQYEVSTLWILAALLKHRLEGKSNLMGEGMSAALSLDKVGHCHMEGPSPDGKGSKALYREKEATEGLGLDRTAASADRLAYLLPPLAVIPLPPLSL